MAPQNTKPSTMYSEFRHNGKRVWMESPITCIAFRMACSRQQTHPLSQNRNVLGHTQQRRVHHQDLHACGGRDPSFQGTLDPLRSAPPATRGTRTGWSSTALVVAMHDRD